MTEVRRVLVCGDREWKDGAFIEAVLRELVGDSPQSFVIAEGECRGADILAREASERIGIPVSRFPAHWRSLGPAAGPIRNRAMFNETNPHLVLAFHDDIENSKGTADMIKVAYTGRVPTKLYSHAGVTEYNPQGFYLGDADPIEKL